jgi:hypothetical protein
MTYVVVVTRPCPRLIITRKAPSGGGETCFPHNGGVVPTAGGLTFPLRASYGYVEMAAVSLRLCLVSPDTTRR